MHHALLLSPDDQAVSAITGVLEEMSVTCERPLDGASAAQKLSSQTFDLVLVDCENLPAAKLIFDVCRRGKNGNNPVPIAIVDGRAGLPTAFRLGAELILTKPVAKDQARSTIRTAVSRVRKDVPTDDNVAAHTASAGGQQERTSAAAASSQLTNYSDPASNLASNSAFGASLSIPSYASKMKSALDEVDAPAASRSSRQSTSFSVTPSFELPSELSASGTASDPTPPVAMSDDPVMAEIEETELKKSELESSKLSNSEPDKPAPILAPTKSAAQSASSKPQVQPKRRGPLVALLMFALVGAGFYTAWMYQPGFRELAQPQIDGVLALVGMAHQQSAPPAKASAVVKPTVIEPTVAKPTDQLSAATSLPASQTPANTNQTVSVPANPAPGSSAGAPATSTPGAAAPANVPAPLASSATKPVVLPAATASAAATSDAQLPGEKTAIILSSKGAEKRLAHSVPPKYPAEAGSADTQGTVVLKTVVDEEGKVDGVRLVEGNATLAPAAIQAVKQWRYRPYMRDGKALPFQTVVIIDFQRP
jgi:periplasmic protein TonB